MLLCWFVLSSHYVGPLLQYNCVVWSLQRDYGAIVISCMRNAWDC